MIKRVTRDGQTTVMDDSSGIRKFHNEPARPGEVDGQTTTEDSPKDTPEDEMGWGDKVERQLKSFGITPEKYVAIKEKFGLPPSCNCKGRKEWLNKVGEYFTK